MEFNFFAQNTATKLFIPPHECIQDQQLRCKLYFRTGRDKITNQNLATRPSSFTQGFYYFDTQGKNFRQTLKVILTNQNYG